jgi:chorismate mutase
VNAQVIIAVAAAYGKDGQQYSLCEYILRETEMLHGKVRRYTSPDEHAFYPGQQT